MRNYELRGQARKALQGQWGINAAVILVVMLIQYFIAEIVLRVTSFQANAFLPLIVNFLLGLVILFAFDYGQFYIALEVSRGNRAEISDVFSIFQKQYYVPMAIFNLISVLIKFAMNLIITIPILLIFGLGSYITFVLGGFTTITSIVQSQPGLSTGIFIVIVLAIAAVSAIIGVIISGIFQFAAWAKIDNPELPPLKALSYGWFLLKDRLGQFILLHLSFIGWYLTFIFVLPMFWVIPYVNVTLATFYNELKEEKGFPVL